MQRSPLKTRPPRLVCGVTSPGAALLQRAAEGSDPGDGGQPGDGDQVSDGGHTSASTAGRPRISISVRVISLASSECQLRR